MLQLVRRAVLIGFSPVHTKVAVYTLQCAGRCLQPVVAGLPVDPRAGESTAPAPDSTPAEAPVTDNGHGEQSAAEPAEEASQAVPVSSITEAAPAVAKSPAAAQTAKDSPSRTQQVLRICTGHLPEQHAACEAFFFIRNKAGKLAVEDLATELEFGVLAGGPSLKMLEQVRCCSARLTDMAISEAGCSTSP